MSQIRNKSQKREHAGINFKNLLVSILFRIFHPIKIIKHYIVFSSRYIGDKKRRERAGDISIYLLWLLIIILLLLFVVSLFLLALEYISDIV